jgi:ribosomal protein RSM22 (predicted rRNA methylase)
MVKKAAAYEENTMKINRLQEEKNALKRKLERAKRMEKYENMDELLQEENKQLKASLIFNILKLLSIFAAITYLPNLQSAPEECCSGEVLSRFLLHLS